MGFVTLTNRETGKGEVFDQSELQDALASNKYVSPDAVAIHRMGQDTYAAPDVAREERVLSPVVDPAKMALQAGHKIREDANSGIVGGAKAFIGSGLSGASLGAISPFEDAQEFHPVVSTIGNIGGGLLTGELLGVGRLGKLASEAAGGGILGGVAGGVAEGSAYGLGNGVQEIARSDDPLVAEHALSILSSNLLLGAGFGGVAGGAFKIGERALTRAGSALSEAAAARGAIEGIPGDLAGLDNAALKEAHAAAASEHAADIAAERRSIEGLRVEQRTELANQIRDLHTELATERPIFTAITELDRATLNPALKGIEGVDKAQVQLAKSYKAMRSGLDSEISVARDPGVMIRPLEMRQAALETLQAKAPELQAALAGDARAAALSHVDEALAQTKQQIDTIRALSRETPVSSGRLTMLKAGDSPRMQAIDAAREALKNAPEMGLLAKGATTAAFAGGTALAHMIPGVGIAAPFVGKAASEMVGKLFGHLAGGMQVATEKSAAAIKSFLNVTDKIAPVAPMVATKVLSAARFGEGPEAKSQSLPDLYKARSTELRQQTQVAPDGSIQMRPEARMALSQRLGPIATVNPLLADQIETAAARKIAYMSSKIPKHPEINGIQIGPDTWHPSDMQIRSWARTVRACEDPQGVEDRLAHGTITPEDAEAYRTCYPERFAALQQAIFSAVPQLSKTLPTRRKVALFVFTGVPTMPALQPNILSVLQGNFAAEPGTEGGTTAPKPMPQFGALGSMKDLDKPTAAQQGNG